VTLIVIVMPAGAQERYPRGVFVAPRVGDPIQRVAYAEMMPQGEYRMARGSLEDVPVVEEVAGALVNTPFYQPRYVFVTTAAIFEDMFAERRQLPVAQTKLSINAVHVRAADLENREKIDALLKAVGASPRNPGYAFIAPGWEGYVRYYPIRLTPVAE
jgi:hypothetical protein